MQETIDRLGGLDILVSNAVSLTIESRSALAEDKSIGLDQNVHICQPGRLIGRRLGQGWLSLENLEFEATTLTRRQVLGCELQGQSASVSQGAVHFQCQSRRGRFSADLVNRRHRSARKRDGLLCLQGRGWANRSPSSSTEADAGQAFN